MHVQTRKFVIGFVFALILAAVCSTPAAAQDPGIRDTVYVDSVGATSFNGVSIPIYVYNDEPLAGLEVTLSYDSPDVMIDSFSFVGGKVAGVPNKGFQQLTATSIDIYCVPIGVDPIPTGSDYLGSLYLSFIPGLSPQVVKIDSITLLVGGRTLSTSFSTELNTYFTPSFVPGYVDIKLGSCCLGDRGNIDNSPDDVADITDLIYLVDYMFGGGPGPVCEEEANVDGSVDGVVDISDVIYFVDWMFGSGPPPPSCP